MAKQERPELKYRLKVGDPVFVRGNRMDCDHTVVKVGRDYYTLDKHGPRVPIYPDCREDAGCRAVDHNGRVAWLSQQAMDEWHERARRYNAIRHAFDIGSARRFSLDELRAIYKIVFPQGDGTEPK